MLPIEIYTDGSCLKNPGPGGCAWIIRYWKEDPNGGDDVETTVEGNQGYRFSTNNRMEITAALTGISKVLEMVKDGTLAGANQINLWSDSEYLCNAMNQHWVQKWKSNNWMTAGYKDRAPNAVKNKDLWEKMLELQADVVKAGLNLVFCHVKGHNGHEFNERADQLAFAASSGTSYITDEGYEKFISNKQRDQQLQNNQNKQQYQYSYKR